MAKGTLPLLYIRPLYAKLSTITCVGVEYMLSSHHWLLLTAHHPHISLGSYMDARVSQRHFVFTLTVLAGKDLPADEACEMMTGDVDEELDDLTAIMCQASIASCMQAYNTRLHGAGAWHCLATCPPQRCISVLQAIPNQHSCQNVCPMLQDCTLAEDHVR